MYLYGRHTSNQGEVIVKRSIDGGETWSFLGESGVAGGAGTVFNQGVSSVSPVRFTATPHAGRIAFIHNLNGSTTSAYDRSICAAYLGGYSTVTLQGDYAFRSDTKQMTWEHTYLPFDLPENVGWTKTGVGTVTRTTDGYLQIQTTAAQQASYTETYTATSKLMALFAVKPTSGGSTGTQAIVFRAKVETGGSAYEVALLFHTGSSSATVIDYLGVSTLGVISTADLTASGLQILIAMDGNKFRCWYRADTTASDRQWTAGPTSTSLTAGATAGSNRIIWGCGALSATTAKWKMVFVQTASAHIGIGLAAGLTNPDDLFWRNLTNNYVYVDDGLKLRAVDGPAMREDEHAIGVKADYGLENIFPQLEPSPRKKWRSLTDDDTNIAWEWIPGLNALGTPSRWLNNSYGFYLTGCNFQHAYLQYYEGGTWQTLNGSDGYPAITFYHELELPYNRSGNTLVPKSSASVDRYIHYNELAGAKIILGAGVYEVERNTEGLWKEDASVKQPTIYLRDFTADDDLLEPLTSLVPAKLMVPSAVTIIHATTLPPETLGLRLYIPSQTTKEGYFEIGSIVFGPLLAFGTQYAWTRQITSEANTELTTFRDGSRRSNKRGPVRRKVSFQWTPGVDMSDVFQDSPSPDYCDNSSVGGLPIASRYDTPYQVMQAVAQQSGAHMPVVYLPYIPRGTENNAVIRLNGLHEFLYGRITSPITINNVVGDENESEMFSVASVTIEEEV